MILIKYLGARNNNDKKALIEIFGFFFCRTFNSNVSPLKARGKKMFCNELIDSVLIFQQIEQPTASFIIYI